jgi:diacylglycerol O-acyltransferase / wax synthase
MPPDRLSAIDASFLYLEQPTTPMHAGGVAIFRRPRNGFGYDRLVELIEQRLALIPRYRQKVRNVPGHLARPVWVDDPSFDVNFHVRRSALPKPGTDEQLNDLVGRLMSRPLDRGHPLWELHLVEGLAHNRFAIVTKTHHAMIGGISPADIGQVILDVTPTAREAPADLWMPLPEPSSAELVATAIGDAVRRPAEILDNARIAALDATATLRRAADALGDLFSAVRTAVNPAPGSPLNVPISTQRRFAVARTGLEDYKLVRHAHGGTVNDVVLAVVSGALRNWLLSRGEAVTPTTRIRALAPVSVRDANLGNDGNPGKPGNKVTAYLVDLPVGEANPVVRLHHVSHAMRGHKDSGQSVGADALVRLSDLAPPTMHALGARVANGFSQRIYNLVVTNVPGPQIPLYAAGAKMLETFPVVPLAKNQGLSIGITSYNGGVYFGLNVDRDAITDVDGLAAMIEESLEEMVGTVPR